MLMKVAAARTVDKTLVFVGVVGLALLQNNIPSAVFWTQVLAMVPQVPLALVVIGCGFAIGPTEMWVGRRVADRRLLKQRDLLIQFGKILVKLQKLIPTLDFRDVGLHIWVVRGLPFRHRLKRIASYRLGGQYHLRKFEPKSGVGTVGLCWAGKASHSNNVEALAAQLTSEKEFDEEKARSPESVMGMDWKTFQDVRGRGAVFAAPILSTSQDFEGCVSLDTPFGYDEIIASDVPAQLNELANSLSGVDVELLKA